MPVLVSEKSISAGASSGTAGAPSTRQKLARVLARRKIPLTLQFLFYFINCILCRHSFLSYAHRFRLGCARNTERKL